MSRVYLIGDCADAQWIDAPLSHYLSIRIQYSLPLRIPELLRHVEVSEKRTILLRLFVWRLSTDHGYVVVEALMANAVIMSQQYSISGKSFEVGVGSCAERDLVALVLEDN